MRMGATNDVFFRVVASDARFPRDGKSIERLGWYDPRSKEGKCQLKLDRIEYWLSQGAQISDTVASLVRKAKKAAATAAAAKPTVA
jgi:small subunit ribosomal protein S16